MVELVAEVAVPPDPALDAEWENEWMLHHYRTAMEGVRASADPKSVEVFEFLLAGHSVSEVAQRFEMTADAVHKVKQRIRDRLKKRISEQVLEDEAVV